MRKTTKNILSFTLLSFLLASCAAKTVHTPIFEKGEEHVWLQRYAEDTSGETYEHPAEIKTSQIAIALDSIVFEELALFKWSIGDKVFSDKEKKRLVPLLSKALGEAKANEWVHFALLSLKDGYIGKTKHITNGIVFVKGGKLNIVFLNINYEIGIPNIRRPHDRKQERNYGDPRLLSTTDNMIRLMSNTEAGFTKPPLIKGDRFLSQEHANWLVFDTKGIMMSKLREKEKAKTKKIKSESLSIAERLRILKDLRDQELISSKEYRERRKGILGDL